MSFFDEVVTAVENTRLIKAVQDSTSAPVQLKLRPYEVLGEKAEKLRVPVSTRRLLLRNTVLNHCYLLLLKNTDHSGLADAAALVTMIHDFAKLNPSRRREEAAIIVEKFNALADTPLIVSPESQVQIDFDLEACDGRPASKSSKQNQSHHYKQVDSVDSVDLTTTSTDDTSKSSAPKPTPPTGPPPANVRTGSKFKKNKAQAPLITPDENRIPIAPVNVAIAWGLRARYAKHLDRVTNMLGRNEVPPHLFDECLNQSLAPLLNHTIQTFFKSTYFELYTQLEDFIDNSVTLDDFKLFRILGRGTFGAVYAAQERQTHAVYAVKQISKKMVKSAKKGYEWMVQNEQRMLKTMTSPYVLNLHASLDDNDYLYLIFDICTGGDLGFHLKNESDHRFSFVRARFYAAQVLLGLEHMHSHNIVYRDLKPSNIILDEDGNVKLSDLGLSIRLHPTKILKHVAGTAGYWAPEILSKTGTYKTSDFWSFGVLLFEMFAGHRPILRSYLNRYGGSSRRSDVTPRGPDEENQNENENAGENDQEQGQGQGQEQNGQKQNQNEGENQNQDQQNVEQDNKKEGANNEGKLGEYVEELKHDDPNISLMDGTATSNSIRQKNGADQSDDGGESGLAISTAGPPSEIHSDADVIRTINDASITNGSSNITGHNQLKDVEEEDSNADRNTTREITTATDAVTAQDANAEEEKINEATNQINDENKDADEGNNQEDKKSEAVDDSNASNTAAHGTKTSSGATQKIRLNTEERDSPHESRMDSPRRYRFWSPFSNSPGHDSVAREPDSICDIDIDYPSSIPYELRDLLERIFVFDPSLRIGAEGVEEIKKHPFFGTIGDLEKINWEALTCKDVTPPYTPEALKVHAHSVEQVGAFDEGRWRSVKITDADNAHYAKWTYVNRNNRELAVAAVLPLLKLDHLGRALDDSANKTCCSIM